MESLKKALAMVRQAHKKQAEKSGNTNYFVVGVIILFLIFNKAEVGGVIFTTKDQQDMTRDVILLKEDWPEFKKSICELGSATTKNASSIAIMNERFLRFEKNNTKSLEEIKEMLKFSTGRIYADN